MCNYPNFQLFLVTPHFSLVGTLCLTGGDYVHSMEQNRVISQTFRWKAVRSSGLLASHEILTISWAIETYDLVGTINDELCTGDCM